MTKTVIDRVIKVKLTNKGRHFLEKKILARYAICEHLQIELPTIPKEDSEGYGEWTFAKLFTAFRDIPDYLHYQYFDQHIIITDKSIYSPPTWI